MPFSAFCRKCEHFMIGKNFWAIKKEIADHFKDSHDASPKPNPYSVQFLDDFERNQVDLLDPYYSRPFTYTSRLFSSEDYYIAVITHNDYDGCQAEPSDDKQKDLRLYLSPYFLIQPLLPHFSLSDWIDKKKRIKARCLAPKYAKGEPEFQGFEELFNWLVKIRGLPRGNVGSFLYKLAKDGHVARSFTTRYDIEIESDFHDYFLAGEVARKVGLLHHKRGAFEEVVSLSLDLALNFAKVFDEQVLS